MAPPLLYPIILGETKKARTKRLSHRRVTRWRKINKIKKAKKAKAETDPCPDSTKYTEKAQTQSEAGHVSESASLGSEVLLWKRDCGMFDDPKGVKLSQWLHGLCDESTNCSASDTSIFTFCIFCNGMHHMIRRMARALEKQSGIQRLQWLNNNVKWAYTLHRGVCQHLTMRILRLDLFGDNFGLY